MKSFLGGLLAALLLSLGVAAPACAAAADTPVGLWKTIDDETGKVKSLVEISESGGTLHGKVVKLFNPSEPNPTCDKCEGPRKDRPILGMEILWGLGRHGDEWSGGQILDPEKGKVYGCKLSLADDGQKLQVRGFLGFSLLGRTQTWLREPSAAEASDAPTAP